MSKKKDQQNQARPGEPDMGREAPRAGNQQQQHGEHRPQQGAHNQSPGQPGSQQHGSQQHSSQQRQYGSHDNQKSGAESPQERDRSVDRNPGEQNRDKP